MTTAHATPRRVVLPNGYVQVFAPKHPRADIRHSMVYEHLLVAEAAMGKPVPCGAQVHHVNGDPGNNAGSNLVVCENQAYHHLLHIRASALVACGNANALRCSLCSTYDRQEDISVSSYGVKYHRACKAANERLRRQKRRAA